MERLSRVVPYFFILSFFFLGAVRPLQVLAIDEAAVAPSEDTAVAAKEPAPDATTDTTAESVTTEDQAAATKDASAAPAGEGQTSALMGGSGGTSTSGQSMNQTYGGAADAFSKIDEQTGAFTYGYPLEIPQGRNGMQPDLQLQYSSSATSEGSIVGYGWSLSLPTIERLNKNGLNELYTSQTFVSSLAGGELIADVVDANGYGTYLPRIATPGFVKFEYLTNGSWKATDPSGIVYTFGVASTARLADPADATKVFRWYVESIVDPNGNGVVYTYTTIGTQMYPNTINYTTNGVNAGFYTVTFFYEDRADVIANYDTGFEVTTTKRVSRIEVAVGGVLRKKFVFAYTSGIDGERSLLDTLTTTGYDLSGVATVLSPLDLSYVKSTWTDYGEEFRQVIANTGEFEFGNIRFGDINGDGLADAMYSYKTTNRYIPDRADQKVFLSTGTDWVEDSSWVVPIAFNDTQNSNGNIYDHCASVIDVNGDDLADIVYKNSSVFLDLNGVDYPQGVYINNGSGWALDSTWVVPVNICNIDNDQGVRFADLDGDGLVDIFNNNETAQAVYLNNGNGWDLNSSWSVPVPLAFSNGYDAGVRVADLNGDGLPDLLKHLLKDLDNNPNTWTSSGAYVEQATYINNGYGWTLQSSWDMPGTYANETIFAFDWHSCNSCAQNDYGSRMMDVNGDGLVDVFNYSLQPNPQLSGKYYINNGSEWVFDSARHLPPQIYNYLYSPTCAFSKSKTIVVDMNGDRLDDFFTDNGSAGCARVILQEGDTAAEQTGNYRIGSDLLKVVVLPSGGSINVTYSLSTRYRDVGGNLLNPDMRFSLTTVDKITFDDGLGGVGTYSYEYSGGEVDYDSAAPQDKKFAGFQSIKMTRPDGATVTRYFHQNNGSDAATYEGTDSYSRIGYKYREEVKNASGQVMQMVITNWDSVALGTASTFVSPNTEMTMSYDGDSDHRDTLVDYTYVASTGNLTNELYLGEVLGNADGTYTDISADSITKQYVYAVQAAGLIRNAVQTEYTRDNALVTRKQTRFYYDGLTYLGTVIKGNVTKKAEWITGTSYEDTTYVYDGVYGLVTSSTDPELAVTTMAYDTNNLYPLTVTNDLSQATTYTYDYATGQVLTTTDPNGGVLQTVYDGLGRPLAEKQSLAAGGGVEDVRTYVYTDSGVPNSVKVTNHLSGTVSAEQYVYFDGFGRTVQTRTEHETAGTYSVADTIYDSLGRLSKQSMPYNLTGSSYTAPTTDATLLETYTYDALDRVTSVANAVGTTTSAYDQWNVTETDADGKVKEYDYNWRQLLTAVKENIAGVTKTTQYSYNANGNLVKYTDSMGNFRTLTFNPRGYRTAMQDLHPSSDTQFGSWLYSYDKVGNLLTTTDANGKVITNTYDDLHRILTENDPATTGTDVTYTYDTCTNGVGRLCSVANINGVTTAYTYDKLGRIDSQTQTVDAVARTTTYSYDRQGNLLIQTHPDGSKNEFTYGTAGRTLNAKWRNVAGTTSTLMSSVTYSPTGAPATVTLGNGVVTTYTYDATKLYRLTNKKSVKDATEFQDFTYTYDAVGNITNLVDDPTIYTPVTHIMTYDDVHRLSSATATSTDPNLAGTRNFTYSAIGNLLTSTQGGTYTYNNTGSGVYSNPHAPTTVGTVNYTYDKNGNQLTDGTWTNTWDFKNRLVTSAKTGNTVTYTYDHTGARVKKTDTVSGVPTYYVTPEYEVEGTVTRHHIVAPGVGSIASMMSYPTYDTTRYHLTDHLGGTHVEVDYLGNTLQYMVYEPFGKVRYSWQSGSYSNDYKYTGKEQDSETNWQYYGARYYDNNRGQFMSADPVFLNLGLGDLSGLADPQMWNSYAYARNNPYANIDPDGNYSVGFVVWAVWGYWQNREIAFALSHPVIAWQVGSYNRDWQNISSYAGNFAINSHLSAYGDGHGRGSQGNAFRHVIWQSMITQEYGSSIARKIGNAHENNPYANLSVRSFSGVGERSWERADQTADLLNNQIGRSIGSRNPNASEKELAMITLDYFHNNGLYVVERNGDQVDVVRRQLTDEEYSSARSSLSGTGNDGLMDD